jgi:hypothetical protein
VPLQVGLERSGLQEALSPRAIHGPRPVVCAELAEDGGEVETDGALGDEESSRDLTVGEPFLNQHQHLRLPRAERAVAAGVGRLRAPRVGLGRFVEHLER